MLPLRTIRRRIRSVENTKKTTRAMEMVAAAKLRRFQDLLGKENPYTTQVRRLFENLAMDQPSYRHPLFEERTEPKKICYIVFASDAGLCGTYNANVLSMALTTIEKTGRERCCTIPVGKMAVSFFRRVGIDILASFVEIRPGNYLGHAQEILKLAQERFLSRDLDAIYMVYTHFESLAAYRPKVEKFLNIERPETQTLVPPAVRYILEPNAERIFEALIPQFLLSELKQRFLEFLVAEQVSRMLAMRQATDNAQEIIDDLTLLRNKVRQASITKEIIEVVSGARALRR